MNAELETLNSESRSTSTVNPRLRILLIGINYAPELTGIGPYTTELAVHFAAAGHEVHVITGIPHYPEWRRIPIPSQDSADRLSVSRFSHFIPRRANAAGRTLYELSWLFSASRGLLTGRHDVALGVVPSLSGGLLAVLAGRRWNIPTGLIIKDLMGPAAAQSGYRGGRVVAAMTERAEGWIIRHAHRVAIISEGFQPYLLQKGVPSSRIFRVRDWTHPGSSSESPAACRARLGWRNDDFICLHAGNMGQKQGLDNVLDAAVLLRGTQVRIIMAGDGNDRRRLMERAATLPTDNVTFIDLQPPGRYEAMLRAADVLILNQRASVAEMSLPSKLASYFAAGRPVVGAVARNSPTAKELEAGNAGIVVDPREPAALAQAILHLKSSPALAADMGTRGAAYAGQNLTPRSALGLYDQFLDEFGADSQRVKGRRARSERGGKDGLE